MYHGKDGRCPDDSISTWFYFIFKNLQQLLFVFLKLKFYWHKSLSDASWGTLKFIKRKEPCQRKRISIIQLSSHFSHFVHIFPHICHDINGHCMLLLNGWVVSLMGTSLTCNFRGLHLLAFFCGSVRININCPWDWGIHDIWGTTQKYEWSWYQTWA